MAAKMIHGKTQISKFTTDLDATNILMGKRRDAPVAAVEFEQGVALRKKEAKKKRWLKAIEVSLVYKTHMPAVRTRTPVFEHVVPGYVSTLPAAITKGTKLAALFNYNEDINQIPTIGYDDSWFLGYVVDYDPPNVKAFFPDDKKNPYAYFTDTYDTNNGVLRWKKA